MKPASDLNIAGLVPFSTVDWPGKIAASVFLQGCPWRCPYCHNAEILEPRQKGAVAWSEVLDLLSRRKGLLDGVVFSGGEALMQAGAGPLTLAMKQVASMGFQVGLHTGGAFPKRLRELLREGVVDWVGLDIKAMPQDYERATRRPASARKAEEALSVLADYDASRNFQGRAFEWEVRLTLWPGLLDAGPPDAEFVDAELTEPGHVTSQDLLAYASEVATWARQRGARNFALQRYRKPESHQPDLGSSDAAWLNEGPVWGELDAKRLLADLGFQTLSVR